MIFLSPEGMREVDRLTIERGTPGAALMDAAGRAVAEESWRAWPRPDWRVLVLCGPGNNGGDGFVAARELRTRHREVTCFLAGTRDRLRGDALGASSAWDAAGGTTVELADAVPFRRALESADLVLDALLGTGTRGEIRDLPRELLVATESSSGPVLAVDAPSGLDLRTGLPLGPVPRAALTVTFGAAKLGHVLNEGPERCGRLVVRDIGLDPSALERVSERADSARSLEPPDARALLPLPARRSHKRGNGVLAVVAGSRRYAGAATLSCHGALRSGAGLVYAVVTESVKPILNAALAEVIAIDAPSAEGGAFGRASLPAVIEALRFARPDAVVVGPGLGGGGDNGEFVHALLEGIDEGAPVLLDADGLNAFAGQRGKLAAAASRLALAITPHPGELGRILERPAGELDRDRVEAVRLASAELGCVILLKGAPTVVCAPGRRTHLNTSGNAGLARGGTGDVLSGLAGSFLAKGLKGFEALTLAAYVHGLAGDLARHELGVLAMTASDVAERLAPVLRALETGEDQLLQARTAADAPAGGET